MILANGKVYPSSEQDRILAALEEQINQTRAARPLEMERVISAIDRLGGKVADGTFNARIAQLGIDGIEPYIALAARLMRRENITYKVTTELGENFFQPRRSDPPLGLARMTIRPAPLGTLFHIAAGNVDALPAFSVAEGLLTGNINILKLPQADQGLSVEIFLELIKIEPLLQEYIYVFDTPSTDLQAMKKMARMSDGVVVWGGDAAVQAVRQFAPPGIKIIEWGHKLGFAYLSGYANCDEELSALAAHILSTRQLLCSSCQTIFLDTEEMEEVEAFCQMFLPYLEQAAAASPITEVGAVAEMTMRRYYDTLESALNGGNPSSRRVFQGERCSLIACEDAALELSYMYGNCLVKRLPEKKMMTCLRASKGYLQTAGLICSPDRRKRMTDLLVGCGVNRIMTAGHMSEGFSGEAHDGEYPLRRYTRIVNIEE